VNHYLLHGYQLDSPLALTLPQGTGREGRPVLTAVRGQDGVIPAAAPPGALIAQFADRDRQVHYTIARTPEHVVLRFHGAADVVGDPALQHVEVRLAPGVDADLTSVLLVGATMATKLLLDGHLVLHSSAVVVQEEVMAFVGASNMGKSTMAALGWREGLEVISDDVLRVDLPVGGGPVVWPGAGEIRLREKASGLAVAAGDGVAVPVTRSTADGRTAVTTGSGRIDPLPLSSIVIPRPDREHPAVRVVRLQPFDALRRLLGFPRVLGLVDSVIAERQFSQLAELCDRVPVFEARVPWGPPFAPRLVSQVHEQIRQSPG
jgi:hypothetical protein